MASIRPVLDPDFLSAAHWNRSFLAQARISPGPEVAVTILRNGIPAASRRVRIPKEARSSLKELYVERLAKFLLWQTGGNEVSLTGDENLAAYVAKAFSKSGARAFDAEFFSLVYEDAPAPTTTGLGGHWEGCRIGFDLGASDKKVAAVIDGKVVYTKEIRWDPGSFADPDQHLGEITDSIRKAADALPRVDAIGGCSAGIFAGQEMRVSTIISGIPKNLAAKSRTIFTRLRESWKGVPFAVVNDGAAAALAGSMLLGRSPVLGLALGSSLAAGYVGSDGKVADTIDELAFAPIDFGPSAAVDDWSGDSGTASKYLSQQALERLLPRAGIAMEPKPLPEQLQDLQKLMAKGDERAAAVYETLGAYLGHAIAHYADFYDLKDVLVLGRMMTGMGGELSLSEARRVLNTDFPELGSRIVIGTLDESGKRFGQAVAAASLPPA